MEHKRFYAIIAVTMMMMFSCSQSGLRAQSPQITTPETHTNTPQTTLSTDAPPTSDNILLPADFEYLGAFRLPRDGDRPRTFAYSGNAMTFNPDGDSAGAADGFPGSLFIMGHDRMPYGDLPDGGQIAEVNIPAPIISQNMEDLNNAEFIQGFANIMENHFIGLDEIPKAGMQYLNRPETGAKIHVTWGEHLQRQELPSHGWFNPTLSDPDFQGEWFIGNQNLFSVNGYMFEIPSAWADTYTGGRYLATGRMRDGGQGGMGPTLFAYRPWNEDGSAPPFGTHLEEVTLLLYENAYNSEDIIRAMNGYQHPDEWNGGTWITTSSGKQAVLFAGTKSNGTKYWYGYVHPNGAELPCVDAHVTDFTTCRNADGSACPAEDFLGCCNADAGECISNRGWWSTHFDAEFILYDPNDFAKVINGEIEPWQPQPYASIDIDEFLYFTIPEWEVAQLSTSNQRRERIGDVTYDRANHLLYVLELYADEAAPIIHVWRVK